MAKRCEYCGTTDPARDVDLVTVDEPRDDGRGYTDAARWLCAECANTYDADAE